jgi:hypothetical protein|tara:strand:+ start:109 stop:300 length:192 start_codon:yes stop_codon:yes gene_type:complete
MFGFEPYSAVPFSTVDTVTIVINGNIFEAIVSVNTITDDSLSVNQATAEILTVNTILNYEAER